MKLLRFLTIAPILVLTASALGGEAEGGSRGGGDFGRGYDLLDRVKTELGDEVKKNLTDKELLSSLPGAPNDKPFVKPQDLRAEGLAKLIQNTKHCGEREKINNDNNDYKKYCEPFASIYGDRRLYNGRIQDDLEVVLTAWPKFYLTFDILNPTCSIILDIKLRLLRESAHVIGYSDTDNLANQFAEKILRKISPQSFKCHQVLVQQAQQQKEKLLHSLFQDVPVGILSDHEDPFQIFKKRYSELAKKLRLTVELVTQVMTASDFEKINAFAGKYGRKQNEIVDVVDIRGDLSLMIQLLRMAADSLEISQRSTSPAEEKMQQFAESTQSAVNILRELTVVSNKFHNALFVKQNLIKENKDAWTQNEFNGLKHFSSEMERFVSGLLGYNQNVIMKMVDFVNATVQSDSEKWQQTLQEVGL